MLLRQIYDLSGIVQGVGFRPAVKRLADSLGLTGSVQNRAGTVRLVLEGEQLEVRRFISKLLVRLPDQAIINESVLVSEELVPKETNAGFYILDSLDSGELKLVFPPDLAICQACRHEILDPQNRRFRYAFTTCTDCGPRFSVISGMPYDRAQTTLNTFPLCAACQSEYLDQGGRRYHAQSIACADCGPALGLFDSKGTSVEGDALRVSRQLLDSGALLAVRGIGGYLIAANAFDNEALSRLRQAKKRPAKPLAVMMRSIDVVRRFCVVAPAAEELLSAVSAPIVILDSKPDNSPALPFDMISPDTSTVGVMLPYSPLHVLLFEACDGDPTPSFDALVMTSGNKRSEPICLTNSEAFEKLGGIVDFILTHDREINFRADDSLIALQQSGGAQLWRRARGVAPLAQRLSRPLDKRVLGFGAELKNTVAFGVGLEVTASPHIGDLETPEALDGLEKVISDFPALLRFAPEIVAVDLHPDMHSTRVGENLAAHLGLEVCKVQHHHAHAAACLAENGLDAGLALVFDGTGYGTDGTIWGGELLWVDKTGFKRLAHFLPVPLPGGDSAVRRPARQVIARLINAEAKIALPLLEQLGVSEAECEFWATQISQGLNAPMSSAAGRVFDAFSCLLGFSPREISYEGQAAIKLETAARTARVSASPRLIPAISQSAGVLNVDWSPVIQEVIHAGAQLSREGAWALAVHQAIADAALAMVQFGVRASDQSVVALTGGVFMNRLLTAMVVELLETQGVTVVTHRQVPPNDGGISFGQVCVAGGYF